MPLCSHLGVDYFPLSSFFSSCNPECIHCTTELFKAGSSLSRVVLTSLISSFIFPFSSGTQVCIICISTSSLISKRALAAVCVGTYSVLLHLYFGVLYKTRDAFLNLHYSLSPLLLLFICSVSHITSYLSTFLSFIT